MHYIALLSLTARRRLGHKLVLVPDPIHNYLLPPSRLPVAHNNTIDMGCFTIYLLLYCYIINWASQSVGGSIDFFLFWHITCLAITGQILFILHTHFSKNKPPKVKIGLKTMPARARSLWSKARWKLYVWGWFWCIIVTGISSGVREIEIWKDLDFRSNIPLFFLRLLLSDFRAISTPQTRLYWPTAPSFGQNPKEQQVHPRETLPNPSLD